MGMVLGTSLLIGLILLLRKIWGDKCSPNVRYFLWIFVAVRMLVPLQVDWEIVRQVPAAYEQTAFSKGEEADSAGSYTEVQKGTAADAAAAEGELKSAEIDAEIDAGIDAGIAAGTAAGTAAEAVVGADLERGGQGESETGNPEFREWSQMVRTAVGVIRVLGSVMLAAYMVIVNVHHFAGLPRKKVMTLENGLPVYEAEGYNCLVGIVRPGIYLSPQVLADSEKRDYVLMHELEHYRVRDNFWLLLKNICLILQWFNPFVWLAYFKAQEDCELACDYRVLKHLKQEQREAYGETLLHVLHSTVLPKNAFVSAMGNDKKVMQRRLADIFRVDSRKKRADGLLLAGVLLAVGMTFVSCTVKQVPAESQNNDADSVSEDTDSVSVGTDSVSADTEIKSTASDILFYQDGIFGFDGLSAGEDLSGLQELHPEVAYEGVYEGVWEDESVYTRCFYSGLLEQEVRAVYYFDQNGLHKGVYEVTLTPDTEEAVLEQVREYYLQMAADMGLDRGRTTPYLWKDFLEYNRNIYYADDAAGVIRLSRYEAGDEKILEWMYYQGFELSVEEIGLGGWPMDTKVCWNIEEQGNQVEKDGLEYTEVWLVDFGRNRIVADPFELGESPEADDWLGNEKGERISLELAENCEIWGMLDPANWGQITFEQLVRSELEGSDNGGYLRWEIGVNAEGKVEHILQCLLP